MRSSQVATRKGRSFETCSLFLESFGQTSCRSQKDGIVLCLEKTNLSLYGVNPAIYNTTFSSNAVGSGFSFPRHGQQERAVTHPFVEGFNVRQAQSTTAVC